MINEKYLENGNASLAIVQDQESYALYMEFSPEKLSKRLGKETPIVRFDGINPDGAILVRQAMLDLRAGKDVNLDTLLGQ